MKTIKFFAIVVLSAAIAFGIGVSVLALTGSANAFAAISIFGGLFVALAMGAFDGNSRKNSRYDSIRHKTGRSYGNAAIFVGTACLFMGTPQECEELCDDLWHRGVQAEFVELTGSETDFEIL